MLVATAGHVDHGKTSLVRALTGVETDRLPEEKNRGLSIDLGFAYRTTSTGAIVGFVDVPGHERFIRNMLAGVGAIDIALLVVAADDGPMPQTREHLAILELLEVDKLVVVTTRIDLVTESTLDALRESIDRLLAATKWHDSVVFFAVDSLRGTGVDRLRDYLDEAAQGRRNEQSSGYFRMPVDRVFTVQGSGTVVTGAVVSGGVSVGDEMTLLPSGDRSRIRSIHADGRSAESGSAGQRLALNLAGVDRDAVRRGDWIVSGECAHQCDRIQVELRLLATEERPLRHFTPVHCHAGTASITARVALSGQRSIVPSDVAFAELRLDQPCHVLFGDRFVLRDQSATRTIAGGRVVHPFPVVRSHRSQLLEALAHDDDCRALTLALAAVDDGVAADEFRVGRNIEREEFAKIVDTAGAAVIEGLLYDASSFDAATDRVGRCIEEAHAKNPTQIGLEASVVSRLAGFHPRSRLYERVLAKLIRDGIIQRVGTRLQQTGFTPELLSDQRQLLDRVRQVLTPEAIQPPSLSALAETLGEDRLALVDRLAPLVDGGHLVRVADNRYFHPQALEQLLVVAKRLGATRERGVFDARAFRDEAGIGRNVTIDVLEYFDRIGATRRIGDGRTFRGYGESPT